MSSSFKIHSKYKADTPRIEKHQRDTLHLITRDSFDLYNSTNRSTPLSQLQPWVTN
jgi:hypothetical protein